MTNRVIKFRAWDNDELRMVNWESLRHQNLNYNQGFVGLDEEDKYGHKFINDIWIDSDFTLMQFTGLHDKNGVEIYEGDIVTISQCTPNKVVEWDSVSCCFVLRHLPSRPYSENFSMDEVEMLVVGNIYEESNSE